MKCAIVPIRDIKALETARKELFELLKNTQYIPDITHDVTDKMYTITHSRYKETDYDYKKDQNLKELLITIEETLRSYSFSFDCDYKPKPAKELKDLADQISEWIDEEK